ncbi:hypothetical protein [Luedemannella helvata]|uniref:Uncharacterized protein n=1 Tax=Luedemannella helvata TaxID=349315 RepID=A0ABP4XDN0_9ACTN
MSHSFLGRPLETSASYLDSAAAARDLTDARLRDRAATFGLRLLAGLLDGVAADLASRDLAEVALVYDALSEQLADITKGPVEEIYLALVTLCEDPTAQRLVHKLPPPPQAHIDSLRQTVLQIKVTYLAPRGGAARRVIELLYRVENQPMARRIEHSFEWEDLPDDVRAHVIRTDERKLAYQLYPRPA